MGKDYQNICNSIKSQEIKLIEDLKISTLENLYQDKFTVSLNIADLKTSILDDDEKAKIRDYFIEVNNRLAILLTERIIFFDKYNINSLNDIKTMSDIEILKAIIIQIKQLKENIEINKGKITNLFLKQVFNGLLIMLDKMINWADNQYLKYINKK